MEGALHLEAYQNFHLIDARKIYSAFQEIHGYVEYVFYKL